MSLFPIERLPHLPIPQAANNRERHKRSMPKPPAQPQGGEREQVARSFEVSFDRLQREQEEKAQRLPAGIQPHLVFRLPLFENVNIADLEEKLARVGLTIVDIEADKSAVVAFRSDVDLQQFQAAVEIYKIPSKASKARFSMF